LLTRAIEPRVRCNRINTLGDLAIPETGFKTAGIIYATDLVRRICRISGQFDLIEDIRSFFDEIGLREAIQRHDDDAIFDWLVEAISYQGISDAAAFSYIEQHGTITAADIRDDLDGKQRCGKLESYWQFDDCGYRKTAATCSYPKLLRHCPLPRHALRNGSLSQASYSLYLFMRDVADGDFVSWIDGRLAGADRQIGKARANNLRNAVVEPLRHIHGVSDKILNMTMANLLLAGDAKRERWVVAGASMIAIDTLVHNWLHRSGILGRLNAEHSYGNGCYSVNGCAATIETISARIDARKFNPAFPKRFPRFVQKAIWHFCSGAGLDRCNGNRINDLKRCDQDDCPVFTNCDRVVLGRGGIR
jgi:hypothetical protein